MDYSVRIASGTPGELVLRNPVMTASGTFGYGTEEGHLFDVQRLGAVVCKGTTLKPRYGNPQPRIAETPSGMLNAIGLENIGVEALIAEKAPVWAAWDVPVIVNIAGRSRSPGRAFDRRRQRRVPLDHPVVGHLGSALLACCVAAV